MSFENNDYRQSIFIDINGIIRIVVIAEYEHGEKIFNVLYNSPDGTSENLMSNYFLDIVNFVNPKITNFEQVNIYVCNGNAYSVYNTYEQPFVNYMLVDRKILADTDNVLVT
jgi:hypothetical protein